MAAYIQTTKHWNFDEKENTSDENDVCWGRTICKLPGRYQKSLKNCLTEKAEKKLSAIKYLKK